MASDKSRVPQLPAELLESISNLFGPSDILSFRLACKAFVDISFNDFIYWHIQEIHCFFPDPARVERLANITSKPHLVDKIRRVSLTLDAFEYNDDALNFIVPASDRGDTLAEYKMAYRRETLEYHCAQRSSLDLLSRSLERLDPMRCRLYLDIGYRHSFCDHAEWALISQRVFAAVEKALYPIYGLTILSRRDFDEERGEGVRRINNVQHELYCSPLHSTHSPFHSTHLDDPGLECPAWPMWEVSFAAMIEAAAAPMDLESLDIIYWGPTIYPDFSNNALRSASSWTQLKRLTLVYTRLPDLENLNHLLRCCDISLEIFMLDWIAVVLKDGREWKTLFESLSRLSKLEHLHIKRLNWRTNGMPYYIADEEDVFQEFECQKSGNMSINVALTKILREGLSIRNGTARVKLW